MPRGRFRRAPDPSHLLTSPAEAPGDGLEPDPVPHTRPLLETPHNPTAEATQEVRRRLSEPERRFTPEHARRRQFNYEDRERNNQAFHDAGQGGVSACPTCGHVSYGARRGEVIDHAERQRLEELPTDHPEHWNGGIFCSECGVEFDDIEYESMVTRHGQEKTEAYLRRIGRMQ